MMERKWKYAIIVSTAVIVVAALVLLFGGIGQKETEISVITKAPIVPFDEAAVEGWTCTNTFSDYIYSTQKNRTVIDKFKIITDANEFNEWLTTTWDIRQTEPRIETGTGQIRFNDGYIALIISPQSLQDYSRQIAVYGIYTSDTDEVQIVLSAEGRNPDYQYSQNLAEKWVQTYCIVYLKPEYIESIDKLSFAIKATGGLSGECEG